MEVSNFNASVGQEQFLNLLVAQLEYQNPLEPVEQQDFISQLAQFSTLDGVEQLNSNFADLLKVQTLAQGAGLVGQDVQFLSPTSGQLESGRVEQARIVDGQLNVTINEETVPLSAIQAILATPLQ